MKSTLVVTHTKTNDCFSQMDGKDYRDTISTVKGLI